MTLYAARHERNLSQRSLWHRTDMRPAPSPTLSTWGRPRTHPVRRILDASFYV